MAAVLAVDTMADVLNLSNAGNGDPYGPRRSNKESKPKDENIIIVNVELSIIQTADHFSLRLAHTPNQTVRQLGTDVLRVARRVSVAFRHANIQLVESFGTLGRIDLDQSLHNQGYFSPCSIVIRVNLINHVVVDIGNADEDDDADAWSQAYEWVNSLGGNNGSNFESGRWLHGELRRYAQVGELRRRG